MNYRFEHGGLGGHSFGNILLSSLEKVTGSFEKAVEETGRILSIQGKVIPVTTHQVRLKMLLEDKKLLESQIAIFKSEKIHNGYSSLYLEPHPTANPKAIDEIMAADLVVLGPGDLYSSLIPNLLVEGISKALRETKAKKVFVINLMNKKGQTTGFAASNYLKEITRFTGVDVFDYVVVNTKQPEPELLQKYAPQHELVENDLGEDERVVACELLGKPIKHNKKDALAARRSLIRHDPKKLAEELMKLTERY